MKKATLTKIGNKKATKTFQKIQEARDFLKDSILKGSWEICAFEAGYIVYSERHNIAS